MVTGVLGLDGIRVQMEVMSKGFDWGSSLGKEVATMIPVLMLSKSNVKLFSGIKQSKHVLY